LHTVLVYVELLLAACDAVWLFTAVNVMVDCEVVAGFPLLVTSCTVSRSVCRFPPLAVNAVSY
jgi:hypothetical protein